MDLHLILNPIGSHHRLDEFPGRPGRLIKAQSPLFIPPKPSHSSAKMATLPVTISTMEMDTYSSDDESMPSPISSITTTGSLTEVEEGLGSGDDEVMASSLFVDGFKRNATDSNDDDDNDNDQEALSSTEVDCQEEETEAMPMGQTSRCQFMKMCNTDSKDYRKVVSHLFGRNKKCTTQIPEECWIEYCRKHYQRTKYRTTKDEHKNWVGVQLDILCRQLTRLERWGEVRSWEIAIRKKERDILKKEDDRMVQIRSSGGAVNQATSNQVHKCKERRFLGHCGPNKTYDDIRTLITFVKREVHRGIFDGMPGLELLPDIDPVAYPPRGDNRALKDEVDSKGSPATSTNPRKTQSHKRSSSTPSRVSKPATKKEKATRTRRLTRASERYLKLEDDSDISPLPASSLSTTPQRSEPSTASHRKAVASVRKGPSSPAIASSSRITAFSARTAVMVPRKKGLAYSRQPVPRTPSPPPTTKSAIPTAAPSSLSRSGFQPVNAPHRGIVYRPATPRTPPGNVTPSPRVSKYSSASRIDTARNVVFRRGPSHVEPKVERDDD